MTLENLAVVIDGTTAIKIVQALMNMSKVRNAASIYDRGPGVLSGQWSDAAIAEYNSAINKIQSHVIHWARHPEFIPPGRW